MVDPKEIFPGTRVVDKPLTEDQERKALHCTDVMIGFTTVT